MPTTTAWKTSTQPDRPLLITTVCLLLFFTLVATVLAYAPTLPDLATQYGDWIWVYLVTEALVALVCLFGLWFMQAWALYLMAAFLVLRIATAWVWSMPLSGLPLVVGVATLLIGLMYLQQME